MTAEPLRDHIFEDEVPQDWFKAFCQSCGESHSFAEETVGKKARCKHCGFVFKVPKLTPEQEQQAKFNAQKKRKSASKLSKPAAATEASEPIKDQVAAPAQVERSNGNPPAPVAQDEEDILLVEEDEPVSSPEQLVGLDLGESGAYGLTNTESQDPVEDFALEQLSQTVEQTVDVNSELASVSTAISEFQSAPTPTSQSVAPVVPTVDAVPLSTKASSNFEPQAVMICKGIVATGTAIALLVLLYTVCGPFLGTFLALPVVAVHGYDGVCYAIYLLTGGAVRMGTFDLQN